MLLNPHRVIRLIELAELERRVTGSDRILRAEEAALFLKAAYDDASDAARAEFVASARKTGNAWPWSAVQASGARPPLALVLLRGQAESADVDPGIRIPDRGRPDAATWAPLHDALGAWDTATIRRWVTPRGWLVPAIRAATMMSRSAAGSMQIGPAIGRPPGGGGVNPRPPGNGGVAPPGTGSPPPNGSVQPPGGAAPPPGGDMQPVDSGTATVATWRHPAVIAAGATVLTTLGVALYSLGRSRGRALPPPPGPAAPEAPKP